MAIAEKAPRKMSDKEFVMMLKEEVHPAVANVYLEWDKRN